MEETPWLRPPEARYGEEPYEPGAIVPKWDPLRRDRLPDDFPKLEHVADWEDHTFQSRAGREPPWGRFPRYAFNALALAVLAQLLAGFAVRPVFLPLWLGLVLFYGYAGFTERPKSRAAFAAVAMVLAVFVMLTGGAHGAPPAARFFALLCALGYLGLYLDLIADHAVRWTLQQATEDREKADRWVEYWEHRWDQHALYEDQHRLFEQGNEEEVAALGDLRAYRLGFAVLLPVAVLSLVPFGSFFLVVIPAAGALLWAGGGAFDFSRKERFEALRRAFDSWLQYDSAPTGPAPGTFRSPGGGALLRSSMNAFSIVVLALLAAPALSLWAFLGGASTTTAVPFWLLFFELLAAWLFPLAFITAAVTAILGRLQPYIARLAPSAAASKREPDVKKAQALEWQRTVETLHTSPVRRHREHLFLGHHATSDYPVLMPVSMLAGHAHILGATEAGKTSRVLIPYILQLLKMTRPTPEQLEDGAKDYSGPIIILDLKGENRLFHTVRKKALDAGRTFRFVDVSPTPYVMEAGTLKPHRSKQKFSGSLAQ